MQLKDIAEEMQQRSMAARDWVFQVLRTAIIRGVLPGGMPLRQDEISAQLSVSHIPVREAFRQLDAQGLVRIYPNRGAVVSSPVRSLKMQWTPASSLKWVRFVPRFRS